MPLKTFGSGIAPLWIVMLFPGSISTDCWGLWMILCARYPQPPSPMYDQPPAAPSGSPDFNGEDMLSRYAPRRLEQASDGAWPLSCYIYEIHEIHDIYVYMYVIYPSLLVCINLFYAKNETKMIHISFATPKIAKTVFKLKTNIRVYIFVYSCIS